MKKKLKVLLIEDNKYKYEDAMRILKKHRITDIIHVDNFYQVYKSICDKQIIQYELIILDLCFFPRPPLIGYDINNIPTTESGAKVLYHLLKNSYKIPVIIFSSEEDYMTPLNRFMFPRLEEYCKEFNNSSLYLRANEISKLYDDEMVENKKLLLELNFIIGHAHNELELEFFLCNFLNAHE